MNSNSIKIAIIGSRDFNNYQLVKDTLDPFKDVIDLIVSGGARGADILGEKYADDNNINKLILLADWESHGKAAGFIRNTDIINNVDYVFAFWNGVSKGTADSIKKAEKANKRIKIINF